MHVSLMYTFTCNTSVWLHLDRKLRGNPFRRTNQLIVGQPSLALRERQIELLAFFQVEGGGFKGRFVGIPLKVFLAHVVVRSGDLPAEMRPSVLYRVRVNHLVLLMTS